MSLTLQNMIDDLGARVLPRGRADGTPFSFTSGEFLRFLNRAQSYIATELSDYSIRPIQVSATAQSLGSSGEFDLSSLDPELLEGDRGIISVKITDGKFSTLLTDDERRVNENADVTYSATEPYHHFYGNYLYLLPFAGVTLDLEYKKEPTEMSLGGQVKFDADGTPSTTKFIGETGQSLSAVNDTYNGAVIYSLQHGTYHIVTAYVGATRLFTVTPAAGSNFADNNYIKFQSGEFSVGTDQNCIFDNSVKELVIDRAEGLVYLTSDDQRDLQKAGGLLKIVDDQIYARNSRYKAIADTELDVAGLF